MRALIFLLLLLPSIVSLSQDKSTTSIRFTVLCGGGAQTSGEIETFRKLNEQEDYNTIREKLFEGNQMEMVLSAILLMHYSSAGTIVLTKLEHEKIKQLSKSDTRFTLCFTCTGSKKGTLKQLFSKKKIFTYHLVEQKLLNTL